MANLRVNNLFGESGQDSNGSALFDGSNHLTAANAAAFRVNQGSSEDFTIEAWIYLRATPDGANARIASIYHTSGNQRSYMFYVHTDDTLKFNYASSGTAGSVSTLDAGTVPHNEWVHVAVTHDSSATTVRVFKNGILKATDSSAHATYYANTSGDFTTGEDFNGNISNLHITRGTCKYTGDFIPSKEPIEEDSNTTVLCLNSRFNPLSDDKSNTFTQTSDGAVEASSFIPFDRADSGNVFNGPIKHNTQGYMYFPTGRTVERGRGRGVYGGGGISSPTNPANISYINVQSQGNTTRFGSLTTSNRTWTHGFGSSTRAIWSGGGDTGGGTLTNTIDFVTIATTSNATDFGDATVATTWRGSFSNDTRGISGGGYLSPANINTIDFVTISNLGNATDFGDLTQVRRGAGAMASSTRGVFAGGFTPSVTNIMDFVTIATTANATDFGDLVQASRHDSGGCSNGVRGIIGGGNTGSSNHTNVIQFITIASEGNATDFGDLNNAVEACGTLDNSIRAVFSGSYTPSLNTMDFVTIATTGNATDFGDNTHANYAMGGTSDSHGGL